MLRLEITDFSFKPNVKKLETTDFQYVPSNMTSYTYTYNINNGLTVTGSMPMDVIWYTERQEGKMRIKQEWKEGDNGKKILMRTTTSVKQ